MESEIKVGQIVILEKTHPGQGDQIEFECEISKITYKSIYVKLNQFEIIRFDKETLKQMGDHWDYKLYLNIKLFEQSKLLPKMKDEARNKINKMTFEQLKTFIENN